VVAAQVTRWSLKPTQAPATSCGVHQDEPAVGVVLRRAGLAGDVGADAEALRMARRCRGRWRRASRRPASTATCGDSTRLGSGAELGQHAAVAVDDARDDDRLGEPPGAAMVA
jgi:hypothetical protein